MSLGHQEHLWRKLQGVHRTGSIPRSASPGLISSSSFLALLDPAAAINGDDELLTAIRQLTDARPTYEYRRITALLNRGRRASGAEPINYKRVFRLMAQGRLLLQPHIGHRPIRAHEGRVIALASNQRWSSDGLEISFWNGEIVRLVFAIDTCDREIIAWQASTGGVSGEMVRNFMLACVERRFNALRAPYPVQWLADNGSAFAARETLEFAAALALVPCFTPLRSPERNGVSEAFVKTLKRDYARIQPRPDALTVLQNLPTWIDDYNEITHTAACVCAHLVNSSAANRNLPRVRFNGGNSRLLKTVAARSMK